MTSPSSFIIGHLYKTTEHAQDFDIAARASEQNTSDPNGWVDGRSSRTLSNVIPDTPALIIATPAFQWAIALINDQTVWLYIDDCEPI